jgi:hypothetical protein
MAFLTMGCEILEKWLLDMQSLLRQKCKNVENPGSDNSDFELWSPHDDGRHGSTNKCFLGHQVTYIRRK